MSSYKSYRSHYYPSTSNYSSLSTSYKSRYGTDSTSLSKSSSTSSTSTSKYGSSLSASSYRPSYSGLTGIYRSPRAVPTSTTTTPSSSIYSRSSTSTLTNGNKSDETRDKTYTRTQTSTKLNDDEKEKPKSYARSYTSISEFKDTTTASTTASKKEPAVPQRTSFRSRLSSKESLSTTDKPKTTTTASSSSSSTTKKDEKGPPITFNTRYKSILPGRSRDPSPSVSSSTRDSSLSTLNSVKDKLTNSKYSLNKDTKSRDPSPAVSRRNSQTSTTQTALQRISAYRERERSRSRDPSPSPSLSKNHTPIINKLSQNRSREPSPLAQKLSQLTAEFNSLEKLVAKSRETSREPEPFISNRNNYRSSYSREQTPEKYYRSTSNNNISNNISSSNNNNTSAITTTTASAASSSTTRKPSNKEDIKNSIYNRLSTSRRSSRESSPLEQIKSRFSQQYTPKTSTLNLNSTGSISDLSSSSLLPSRISFINRNSPEKIKSPSPSSRNIILNCQQQTSSGNINDIKTCESEKKDDKEDDGDNDDESDSSSSCSTSTKTPSSTSKSETLSKKSSTSAPVEPPKTKIFIQVRTITRATSPHSTSITSSSSSTRLRRVEIAKTVEKVRQRPLLGPQMVDKATQSDRLDDSARSSRFATSSSSSSVYSSYRNSPSLSSGKYSSKFSREIEANEAREKRESSSCLSVDSSMSIPSSTNRGTSISSRSSISVDKSRSTTPNTILVDTVKCENKDYRKSTLNMGPTNRTIRSSSSSSDNPSSSVKETRKQLQQMWNNQDEFVREKSRGVENSNLLEIETSITSTTNDVEEEIRNSSPLITSPTSREEKINQKIEEAKEFLIKTLGKAELAHSKSSHQFNNHVVDENGNVDINGNYECNILSQSQSEKSVSEEINGNSNNNDNRNNHEEINSDTNTSSKWSWVESNNNKLNECFKKIERVESGEKPWWCRSPSVETTTAVNDKPTNIIPTDDSPSYEVDVDDVKVDVDCKHENFMESRTSPEGVEAAHETELLLSPNDDLMNRENEHNQFISKHRNIDDLLGESSVFAHSGMNFEFIAANDVKIHEPQSNTTANIYQRDEYQLNENGFKTLTNDIVPKYSRNVDEKVFDIIQKLSSSEGRTLQKLLFSLKEMFEDDKDFVHGFVTLGGLNCLLQIGSNNEQNNQMFVLRALGQVMLYISGMNGITKHESIIKWLYSLISSRHRLIVKTSLKLLIVFVEYNEENCSILCNAIHKEDLSRNLIGWSNIMRLVNDFRNADTELLIYAMSLINKTLSNLSDIDKFYDESDCMEQLGMEKAMQHYMTSSGTDLELLGQFHIYETALRTEDEGNVDGFSSRSRDINDKSMRIYDSSLPRIRNDSNSRRKSIRHRMLSLDVDEPPPPVPPPPPPPPLPSFLSFNPLGIAPKLPQLPLAHMLRMKQRKNESDSSSSGGEQLEEFSTNKTSREGCVGVTPSLRRRLENPEHLNNLRNEMKNSLVNNNVDDDDDDDDRNDTDSGDEKVLSLLKRDQNVKDLKQKLINIQQSSADNPEEKSNSIEDLSGLISKAKVELERNQQRSSVKSPVENEIKKSEPKKSEIEMHWDELIENMDRPLVLNDLDFTDLTEDDDINIFAPSPKKGFIPPPPMSMNFLQNPRLSMQSDANNVVASSKFVEHISKKSKKTVKLFWKEIRDDSFIPKLDNTTNTTVWDELPDVTVDVSKLEYLFENRAKDFLSKKQQDFNKSKEIIVLDPKRSNAINIAMTKLPPGRSIRAAILKMDSTVITREGIEKILNMMPTDEELERIQEAQNANPEMPLGSAEQFLSILGSIAELHSRLKLWAFKLDFENIEKEIADPLMDLKSGIDILKQSFTFKCILSHLLTIGCFLNGQISKGFQIDYLAKVSEVRDTVQKHSLLHHLCNMVLESNQNSTDLYSEIGPINRAAKADFCELANNIKYLESECKASWDRLKMISKHETSSQLKQKLIDFLADSAERIIILDIIHRRIINRYNKFLLWLGLSSLQVPEIKPNDFCRILSEFALEYRTTRERALYGIEKNKAANQKFNTITNKQQQQQSSLDSSMSPMKMRNENSNHSSLNREVRKDAELRELLGADGVENSDMNGTFRRRRQGRTSTQRELIDTNEGADAEILESFAKTTTNGANRATHRERKRSKLSDRKLFKRSRTREGIAKRSPSPN